MQCLNTSLEPDDGEALGLWLTIELSSKMAVPQLYFSSMELLALASIWIYNTRKSKNKIVKA